MAHKKLELAAQHIAKARAIKDSFEGKEMDAEAGRTMSAHLEKAQEYRREVEREAALEAEEKWLAEPQYKHDMAGGSKALPESFGASGLLDSERKDLATKAFWNYIRFGEDGLTRDQKAALVEDSTSGGANLVPPDFAGTILKDLPRDAVIRNLATIRPTSSNKVEVGSIVINTAGWGALELTGSTTTDGLGATPANPNDEIYVEDLQALVKIGVNELDDVPALESTVRDALVAKFAELEDDGFAFGSGHANKQPGGIAYGSTITQGSAAAAGQTLLADDIGKLQYAVPAWARRNGVYLAHSTVTAAAMLLKDSNGNYMWQPPVQQGQPAMWRGKPWYDLDGLPAMNATTDGAGSAGTNTSLIFGDVRQGYAIADRRQMRVQRLVEAYAAEGKIGLLFTLRVGGGIIRPKAFARHLL
jgi:HK97 family phage major capsid protein